MIKRILPRNKKTVDYSIIELWKDFKKDNPKLAKELGKGEIGRNIFNKILFRANSLTKDAIVNNPHGFRLPNRMGKIYVTKQKKIREKRRLNVDWKKSKELGVKVYHLNSHSDNFDYSFYWDKREVIFRNKTLYRFEPCRNLRRELAQAVFNKKDYFLIRR